MNNTENEFKIDLNLNVEMRDEFTYIEYHADGLSRVINNSDVTSYGLINKIIIENNSEETVPGLIVTFSFSNDILSIDDIPLPPCSDKKVKLRIPFMKVNKNELDKINAPISSELNISLIDGSSKRVYCSSSHQFSILPISQPTALINDDYFLFAKYVTPLSSYVKGITKKAVLYNDGKSIIAYQNEFVDDMLKELQAIFIALHNENILYQNPPAGAHIAQRIRMADEIKLDKKATCLDSSILFCSCLMEVGYHPLLVLTQNHAFVGVYLDEIESRKNYIYNSLAELSSVISKGNKKVLLFETTLITSGNTASFQDAVDAASEKVKLNDDKEFKAVNIFLCHVRTMYKPIPTSNSNEELEEIIKQKEIEDKDISPISYFDYKDIQKEYELNRFKVWERKLLDLSERNKLVKMNISAKNMVKILESNIVDKLSENDSIILNLINSQKGMPRELIDALYENDDDKVFKQFIPEDMSSITAFCDEKVFQNILSKNKTAIEETGAPTLYLTLGILSYDSPKKYRRKEKNRAPFMLLPIQIRKDKGGKTIHLMYDSSDLKVNETFFEYYKANFNDIDFSSIYDFNDITKYYDAAQTFKNICGANITLDENLYYITNLSFSHQVMWLDMIERQDELSKNQVIKSIIENHNLIEENVIEESESIETLEKYQDFAAPLYYDSSQLKAILDCGEGKSFILDGPPGTGKSQTIVNMITNAFYHGKKVLFVAEKKAALDVVYDRLSKIGLGDYCLELHSNKATKKDFFSKLEEVIDGRKFDNPFKYEEQCKELNVKKDELIKIIHSMHSSVDYYMSLYDCILSSYKYKYLDNKVVSFDNEFLLNFDEYKHNRILKLVDQFILITDSIKNYNHSPLKLLGINSVNLFLDKETIINELSKYYQFVLSFNQDVKEYMNSIEFNFEKSYDNFVRILELEGKIINGDLFLNKYSFCLEHEENLRKSFDYLKQVKETKDQLNELCNIDNLLREITIQQCVDKIKNTSGLFKKMAYNKLAKLLQPHFHKKINLNELPSIMVKLSEIDLLIKEVDEKCKILTDAFGLVPHSIINDVNNVNIKFENSIKVLKEIIEFDNNNLEERINYFVNLYTKKDYFKKLSYQKIKESYDQFIKIEETLVTKYLLHKHLIKKDYIKTILDLLCYASDVNNFKELHEISIANKLFNGFKNEGISAVVDEVLVGNCRNNELDDLFEASLSNGYLKLYFAEELINEFIPAQMENKIETYRQAIDEYSKKCIKAVKASISSKFVEGYEYNPVAKKIGLLSKSIKNGGRGMTIRGTLSEFSDVILTYFPCFLMSPLSAAQYLSVDGKTNKQFPKFDIVIFDEASQIPTHEAIGPIARGTSLIVAGDPKQMPPSPYFSSGLQLFDELDEDMIDDKAQFNDSPSLLDECIAIRMPRHRLMYHYRSKFEELIQFSNNNFYSNQLYTFPSSARSKESVKFVPVNLKESKRDSKITDDELNAIINEFKEIYSNPKTWNKSVGIISFNITQADKIMDSINEMLEKNPSIRERVEKAEEITQEPRFVKSIENVQGDERDIIIISIGFSLNNSGYPAVRGPIVAGDNNGERRLNVIASRSKEKMIVVSTIRAGQFQDDTLIKNPGTKCLKRFLRYVEDCSLAQDNHKEVSDNNIIYYLKRDLEKVGCLVDINVGNSEFKVDLAIKGKETDDYSIGILVDTKDLSKNISCRDKFYVQNSMLKNKKWNIINIYTIEYFRNPELTINKIISKLEDVNNNKSDNIVAETLDISHKTNASDITKNSVVSVNEMIDHIISKEHPISENQLITKLINFYNIKDKNEYSKKMKDILKRDYFRVRTIDYDRYFYWNDISMSFSNNNPISGRSFFDISKEEIFHCIEQIKQKNKSIMNMDLLIMVLENLKCKEQRLDDNIMKKFEYVIKYFEIEGDLDD